MEGREGGNSPRHTVAAAIQIIYMDNTTLGHTEAPFTEALPVKSAPRRCTDLYCLLVFAFLNVCMWTLSGWSYQDGDHFRLERGWDMYGNFCGQGVVSDRPYTFFLDPLLSIDLTICLPGCPSTTAIETLCMYDDDFGLELEDEGCFNSYPSKPFFNNYCLPADRNQRAKTLQWLYSEDQVMTRVVGDLARVLST